MPSHRHLWAGNVANLEMSPKANPKEVRMEFIELVSSFAERHAIEGLAAEDGVAMIDIDGTEVALSKDDCLISPAQKPGFVAESDGGMTVVIDTNLTPALIEKGFVREVISKLQTMRKEAGFDVVDRITVTYRTTDTLKKAIAGNTDAIASAVLATAIAEADAPEGAYAKEWNVNGEKATLSVRKN